MNDGRRRFFVLKLIMLVMLTAIAVRLFSMQIIDGEVYLQTATSRLVTSSVDKAPRGDILDRYGNVLVTNKSGYSVVMRKISNDNAKINETVSVVADILSRTENNIVDTLPVSLTMPYKFIFENDEEKKAWLSNNGIDEHSDAEDVIKLYCGKYEITQEVTNPITRYMVGIRYEAEKKDYSYSNPVTIATDINADAIAELKGRKDELGGVYVVEEYVREYTSGGLATHILGRVGQISAEEYEKNKDYGYGINDIIGKQGIERWAESYLRGVDGVEGVTAEVDGKRIEMSKGVESVPGNYVMLTIDSEIQETLEASLKDTIEAIGRDCNAGAAVVLDVNNGDTLAMASYPTYDMSQFNNIYGELVSNDANPMLNRAVSGLYSPGSTFKPLTAIAGLKNGVISVDETVVCNGVYTYYEDYQPSCWIWSEYHATHGHQNVTQAIQNSCNVYFYELGRRLGIDVLGEYAQKFGLGEYTGIQLTEETEGHMASPDYKEQVAMNITDSAWFGGDTLQTAIGQSYSLFTPVQLANYCATIANGGTRYKVNIIDSIRSSVDGSVVEEFEPEVVETIDIDADTMSKIHSGMKNVVEEGSARSVFEGYPIAVGGKTGTTQLGSGANNAIFIAFAPYDNPEIAIAVVLEHGERGTNAGRVARDVFDKYFFNDVETTEPTESPYVGIVR